MSSMTKREVLDAINATITPNNMNGITAQSLNNVLTSMVEYTPESSGGNGESNSNVEILRLQTLPMETFSELTPEVIDVFLEEWQTEANNTYPNINLRETDYYNYIVNIIPNNASVFERLKNDNKAHIVLIDNKMFWIHLRNFIKEVYLSLGYTVEDIDEYINQTYPIMDYPIPLFYMSYFTGDTGELILASLNMMLSPKEMYNTNGLVCGVYTLCSDGSLVMVESLVGPFITLDPQAKSTNAGIYSDLSTYTGSLNVLSIDLLIDGIIKKVVDYTFDGELFHFTVVENKQFVEYILDSEGNLTKIE